MVTKRILVCGAGGFIGHHLVKRLKSEGHYVLGADLKQPLFELSDADAFRIGDLRDREFACDLFGKSFDEVYQLAADMGGAGYIFTGDNDADILSNSALINLNVLEACKRAGAGRIFYSSSACVYPEHNQLDPDTPDCREHTAYPAAPDSEYGWEKLFSERLYLSYQRNYKVPVRIARYHNVFGPMGAWNDGKEKAPAALCRKIAQADNGGVIEIWGDGKQSRSFLFIEDCLDATIKLTRSEFPGPVNIGSELLVTINELAEIVSDIAGKAVHKVHVEGPVGVRGRRSNNQLIRQKLGWSPSWPLRDGLAKTYAWIQSQLDHAKTEPTRSAGKA